MPAVATAARPEPSPAYVFGTHSAGPPKARVASFGSKRRLADGRGGPPWAQGWGGGQTERAYRTAAAASSTDSEARSSKGAILTLPQPPQPLPSPARPARSSARSKGSTRGSLENGSARAREEESRRNPGAKGFTKGRAGSGAWLGCGASACHPSPSPPPRRTQNNPSLSQRERHEGEAGPTFWVVLPFHY